MYIMLYIFRPLVLKEAVTSHEAYSGEE